MNKGDHKNNIMVSVICCTYNQVDYIEDAIKGFINQQTSFSYEVLINDDGSTDGTSDVISRYAKKKPNVITHIEHETNQRGRINGIIATRYLIEEMAQGKYIALCEGDDYWLDSNKLQRQFDFLEGHDDYSLVLHNAYVCDQSCEVVYLSEQDKGDLDKSYDQIVLEGGGVINPTASFFFRKEAYGKWQPGPVGDHFLMMSVASKGKVRWMSAPMSVYRYGAKGSWTAAWASSSTSQIVAYRDCYISALEAMNKATMHKFDDAFKERIVIQRKEAEKLVARAHYLQGSQSFSEYMRTVSFAIAVKALLAKRAPKLYERCRRIKLMERCKRTETLVSKSLSNCEAITPLEP